jgi:hypothetical protein
MSRILTATAKLKPSKFIKDDMCHRDVSEGSKNFVVATRYIMGYLVKFYNDGMRKIVGLDLDEQELHDSQILRFAHASLLVNQPIGDKNLCYVDSSTDPVTVWIYNKNIKTTSDLKEIANVTDERLS